MGVGDGCGGGGAEDAPTPKKNCEPLGAGVGGGRRCLAEAGFLVIWGGSGEGNGVGVGIASA